MLRAVAGILCAFTLTAQIRGNHPCLPCHPGEVQRFSESPMAHSFGVPANEPDGSFTHAPSSSHVNIYWSNGQLHHKVEERGVSADYPIPYFVGAGEVGRSYLIDLGGHLFQSPASYYTARKTWDVSPGYERERTIDFSRPITSDCLVCHAGARLPPKTNPPLAPLSCERCHGPSENHLRNPVPGSIVNPAKLSRRERDSVCEQCHLEGATSVLNPGKYWWDFRPGERLEDVEVHYVYRTADGQPATSAAVSQAEQLAASMCVRASGGKLWCGSCHDPHGEPAINRKQQIQKVCESCHSARELARSHTAAQTDCVSCHMPRRQASDIVHAAITDHRLRKRPEVAISEQQPVAMVSWHDPVPAFARRDLGLALFNVAKQKQSAANFERAYELLSGVPDTERDAPVQAALGYMLLGSGQARQAVICFKHATAQDAASAEYWLDLGVAENAAGDADSAIQSFERSIASNRYDYRPYEALSRIYSTRNQPELSRSTLSQFLKLVPQSLTIRLNR